MELHQLRYLRAVVRTGSVTAAAEAEHVAQPSISKQMRLLELELGVPLFHRVGRRVVATEAAVELAECAGRVLDDLASTARGGCRAGVGDFREPADRRDGDGREPPAAGGPDATAARPAGSARAGGDARHR